MTFTVVQIIALLGIILSAVGLGRELRQVVRIDFFSTYYVRRKYLERQDKGE